MKRPILASLSTYATFRKKVQNMSLLGQLKPTLSWKLHDFQTYNQLAKVWVAFRMGQHFSLININRICSSLTVSVASATSLPRIYWVWLYFAVLWNCKKKKTAWRACELKSKETPVQEHIATHPFQQLSVSSENFRKLEIFLDHNVWQIKPPGLCERHMTDVIFKAKQRLGQYSSNTGRYSVKNNNVITYWEGSKRFINYRYLFFWK